MVRKILKADVARALGVSDSLVSRYARRGMPTHDVELAQRWYDGNVRPSLRRALRDIAAAGAAAITPADLADALQDAGVELAARLVVEAGADPERAFLAANVVASELDTQLEARGIAADLWDVGLKPNAATQARIAARAAQIEAEYAADDAATNNGDRHA